MRTSLGVALLILLAFHTQTGFGQTNLNARAILERVLANRPVKDFSLKARLLVGQSEPVPVEILIKNDAEATRTIYRAGQTEALVVQPVRGEPRFYLRGTGELTGARRMERLLGSYFSFYDLGLPFLRWPNTKFLDEERARGRDCFAVEGVAEGEDVDRQGVLRVVARGSVRRER
jgi:hypothetical protein